MAHTHPTQPAGVPARPSNAAAWLLFALAAVLLAVTVAVPARAPALIEGAGYAAPATTEDWRGNSARITPAE